MSDLSIQAVEDKIVAIALIPQKIEIESEIVLPDNASGHKPQLYLHVLSVGNKVEGIDPGDVIVCHPNGGQLVILDNYMSKVMAVQEIYGVIKDHEFTEDDYQKFIPKAKDEKKIITLGDGKVIPGRP